jgi:Predicted sugar phosphatases of the HAD superfamily
MTRGDPSSYEAAILDLDGTIYLGDRLIPGAAASVAALRDRGIDVVFLTNKAIDRRRKYAEKLTGFGLATSRDDVINSGWITARYAADRYPDRQAFVIGEDPLVDEFAAAGLTVDQHEPGDLLVVSMDREFTYEKLRLALRTLENGAPFLATNPDRTCRQHTSRFRCRRHDRAVEGVSGRTVDRVLGKPSSAVAETALSELGADPSECLMIGDRLETDIEMGTRVGMETVLVMSGVTDRATLAAADASPDHVLGSIADIGAVLE